MKLHHFVLLLGATYTLSRGVEKWLFFVGLGPFSSRMVSGCYLIGRLEHVVFREKLWIKRCSKLLAFFLADIHIEEACFWFVIFRLEKAFLVREHTSYGIPSFRPLLLSMHKIGCLRLL